MQKWKVFYSKAGQEAPFVLVEADTAERAQAAAYCAIEGIDVRRVVPYEKEQEAAPKSTLADLVVTVDVSEATEKLAAVQAQADTLLATLKECGGACAECKLTISGKDLVAATRLHDYRQGRTE